MDLKSRIKALCKENGITVAKLERDLGFSNAYISQMNPETVPYSRLQKIADYFAVSIDYLQTGKQPDGYYLNPETAQVAQEIFKNKELKALFDQAVDSSPEDLQMVSEFLYRLKRTNKDG